MAISASDVGMVTFLNARLNNIWPTSKDLTLKLFCNNITPSDADVASTYVEAEGGGYVEKTLTNGSWTVNITSNIAVASYVEQIFTFTGPLTTNESVFGYFIVDDDNVLQWAEGFTAPIAPVNNGNHIDITPKFQLSKGTPS